jgi:polyketide synthase PksN
MKDFLQYVLGEVKNKRLSKTDALDLIRQYKTQVVSDMPNFLHPLLQQNTSNLSEQQFSSVFTGEEFFLKDHIINGRRFLPGVASLEMARAAVAQAMAIPEESPLRILLKNVVWARPVIVEEQPVWIHIGLYPKDNVFKEDGGEIAFEIYGPPDKSGMSGKDDMVPVVYSRGNAVLIPKTVAPTVDLKEIRARCNQGTVSAPDIYEVFKDMGINYGPGHQGIETLYVGPDQVLAKLSLPSCLSDSKDQFVLHPCMMDSSLQASLGFMINAGDGIKSSGIVQQKPALPFALQELEVLGKCSSSMWALIRYSEAASIVRTPETTKLRKLDIDLCDEQGTICIRMKGYSTRVLDLSRALEGEADSDGVAELIGTLMLEPIWKEPISAPEMPAPVYTQQVVILCELNGVSPESIETQISGVRCLSLQSKNKGGDKRFQAYAAQVFEEIQNLLYRKSTGKVLVQVVISTGGEPQLYGGLSGLLKTAHLENPKLIGQLIEIDPLEDGEGIIVKLQENSHYPLDNQIRYQNGRRVVAGWREVEVSQETQTAQTGIYWKNGGVYLITGGAGGLGLIFAGEIAHEVKEATLILTGRSPLDHDKQSRLRELETEGIKVSYRQVDVTDKKAVTSLIQSITEEFGSLHGIIHSAGIIKDNFIIKKTTNEFLGVLAPKVLGLKNLDEASKDLPLDFFIFCSSLAGSFGNPGQSDYSTANAFMDRYASYRNHLAALNQRHGRSLSINWPLWQEGGMQVDAETKKLMMQNLGLIPMRTSTGIQALYRGMASGKDQLMVMEGNLKQLYTTIFEQPLPGTTGKISTIAEDEVVSTVSKDLLQEKTVTYFKRLLSSVINLPAHRIEADAPMEKYGIDSLMVMQLTNELEKTFGSLSKTLFYEYQTIRELTRYFLESNREQLVRNLGIETKTAVTGENDSVVINKPVSSVTGIHRHPRFAPPGMLPREDKTARTLDIAIIGVSGRYPRAGNLQEFWKNLRDGQDCITEIPEDRWNHSLYFDEDKHRPGKTYSKWGGFLDGVAEFDPLFFNISPREAEIMDPQERLFLECVYETLEDAGYTRNLGVGQGLDNVGVYVGVMYEEYQLYGAQEQVRGRSMALGGSPSSIANRVSYFCNFHGPSMAVDSMCSSSLTAIHLACRSLQRGDCSLAIAGGVNLSVHPNKYLMLGQGKFVSSKGRCESFGEGGDGYVPGEGVGAVLLKPLAKAIADGDNIYGVIKGTAVNHGGKTNGYSVPNPNAQAAVIGDALKEAGIDPRTISYIEAHGTGTSLGDPIEITGLTKAFREYTKDNRFCAIGSAKSNIGHCESAAGIAGVTKVLLQLRNGQLFPSLHSEVLNPNIDFDNTPFIVQQTLAQWKRPVLNNLELPRRAGVSSFGAGGSNAHIVIEEYIQDEINQLSIPMDSRRPAGPFVIVLSAKNEERLQEQINRLLAAMKERQFSDADLVNIAYSLQVGREAMEERLGLIAATIQDLSDKLQGLAEGRNYIEEIYRGQVKGDQETLHVFTMDEEMREAVDKWIQRKKYGKLLELWVKGLEFDWNKLYGDIKPRRISLPTYPFAKESYWVPDIGLQLNNITYFTSGVASPHVLHPLLHQNTSDIDGLSFSSTFTGEEFFLRDHRVRGRRIMPGVAGLEMARAAVEQIIKGQGNSSTRIRLKNVVWIQPIVVEDQPVRVNIGLYPEGAFQEGEGAFIEEEGIAYEIYNEPVDGIEPIIYSWGNAIFTSDTEIPRLDLTGIQSQCSQNILSSDKVYGIFQTMGFEYGPGHQGIEEIYIGKDQVLAKLSLPVSVSDTKDQYVLHPSIMDSAIQASIGLMTGVIDQKPALPFALQELEVSGRCTSIMWALIRSGETDKAGDKSRVNPLLRKLDIDLCDEQGMIQVRLKGYTSKAPEGEAGPAESTVTLGTLLLEPVWKESINRLESLTPDYARHLVILCENNEVTPETIETQMNQVRCLALQSKWKDIEKRFLDYTVQVFEEIQGILKEKPAGKTLVQIVASSQGEQQLLSGLSGLLNTAQLENPKFIGQFIEVEPGEEMYGIIAKLKENSCHPGDWRIRYQDGQRKVAKWNEVEFLREEPGIPWKDGGIYLITGGAGGLGLIFATEIARQVKNTTLILTGRSPLTEAKQAELRELEVMGTKVTYQQVDVTHKKAVFDLIRNLPEEFGKLDGIIHSAGIIKDNFIIKKTKEEILEVLAPKVSGLLNLDLASREIDLDFFILFSSVSGSFGNPGQADYSTANAFMDAYAKFRNNLVALRQRRGRTLAINWPLWKEGGMHLDRETEKLMMQNTGLIPMRTGTGIRALYGGLAFGCDQVMVVEGNLQRLRAGFVEQRNLTEEMNSLPPQEKHKPVPVIEPDLPREQAINYFKKLLSSVLKLPAGRIDADALMEKYGIDSIMVMQMTNELEKTFGSLSKTLFFEYQTIRGLTEYFLESYRQPMMKLLGIETKAAPNTVKDSQTVAKTVELSLSRRRGPRFGPLYPSFQPRKGTWDSDIAIIGVSGRYPKARNTREFWSNLRNGRDCITEIPEERWDHSVYFDADKDKPGKTYSKWGGFLDGVDHFDPLFFNISPMEAEIMDPQERLFLECVYETLEDAGYTRQSLSEHSTLGEHQNSEGNVGVYVGVMYEEYQLYGAQEQIQGRPVALSGNPASIANRVSYFCNFHGPSLAVDTMCSSSLMAIHLACQSLQRGGCELAIAGGVNVSIHPNKYLMLAQGKFASSKGRCESFGDGGDGYVPGEGVGAVLLKPLSKAVAAGDHIYGVIKGTAVNHGGKTNGYTVPNPKAQAQVIGQALQEAGIDPRTISYIEAHGTGTSLGDPIEITGLTKSFREYTGDNQFCAIGSVKSNIGHCESAAGIAGVTKVLLQLENWQLVPSLHSETLNSNIDFNNTPFFVQRELTEWKRPVFGGLEFPRRAGVSSFGAGGSNAHVIIEEYIARNREIPLFAVNPQNTAASTRAVIVLSAKNEERLREQVRQLLAAIKEGQFSDTNLADIAYTLQVGREAMEERLGLIVATIQELEEKLRELAEGKEDIADIFRGLVKGNNEAFNSFTVDEELREAVDKWIERGKYDKLLEFWVKGLIFDWNKLYRGTKPRRISLPTYPFARESYWIPQNYWGPGNDNPVTTRGITAFVYSNVLHPLLHQNTSDFSEQRFSSTFTGEEFFIKGHVLKGRCLMPEVAYLEMARAAVTAALGGATAATVTEGREGVRLWNVVWDQSLFIEKQPVRVHIGLFPEDNADIAYEIYSMPQESSTDTYEAEPILFSQGRVSLFAISEIPALDLKAIQARCSQGILSSAQIYESFKGIGIDYGSGYQGIGELFIGPDQALVKLSLPANLADTKDRFVLHPSLLDSALQAAFCFMIGSGPFKIAVPSVLRKIEVFGKCTPVMWAHIRYSEGSEAGLDIDLYDEQGTLRVRMKGYVLRVLEVGASPKKDPVTIKKLLLKAEWQEQAIFKEAPVVDYTQRLVILGEMGEGCTPRRVLEGMNAPMNGVRCFALQSNLKSIDRRFQDYVIQVFDEIQTICKEKPSDKVFIQIVFSGQGESQLLSGLSGLLKTARLENPKIIGQLIEVEFGESPEGIAVKLEENSRFPDNTQVRYQAGKRWIAGWSDIRNSLEDSSPEAIDLPWKDGGIYLITGGAGGLGLIFAKEIASKTKDTVLILTGRSSLDEPNFGARAAKIAELKAMGAKVIYQQVDVADKKAVNHLIQSITADYGGLNGIIHSAGLFRDNFIVKKTEEEIREVLAPKVSGLVNLDLASRDLGLDFFILFSSRAGITGNHGQADYAAANAFMDAYAGYRNTLVASNKRRGRTLSINWPQWKGGGMQVDAEIEKLWQTMGMVLMDTRTGIRALYRGLVSGNDQVTVLVEDLRQIQTILLRNETNQKTLIADSSGDAHNRAAIRKDTRGRRPEMKGLSLEQCLEWDLKYFINRLLKIPRDRIDREKNLAEFGFNSIGLTQLAIQLIKHYGIIEITPALFFRYSTVEKLTQYLLTEHHAIIREFYREDAGQPVGMAQTSSVEPPRIEIGIPPATIPLKRQIIRPRFTAGNTSQNKPEPIAIIGMSGRFAGARNIDELWTILATGQNMVREIPPERFDWRQYYGDPGKEPGKINCKWCGCIPGVSEFEPLFFEISPKEAETMDPRQRLLLQEAWRALEDAGYGAEHIKTKKIGMFVGAEQGEYQLIAGEGSITSNHNAILASRLAYFLNLSGPVMAIDTSCSSGLVAAHQAVLSLSSGECDTAIAAGVNLLLTPLPFIGLSQAGMLSGEGKCYAFDRRAGGMVPGEAVAVVVLKRLSLAEADGDPIYAVIKGSGINYDGKTNGITAPSGGSQTNLLKAVYDQYHVNPEEIEYIVTHGTGTKLGDPVEINALYDAFRDYTKKQGYCAITSTKTNFGHTFAASGLVSLISLVQAIQHETIPASLHCEQENDYINWQESPFYVNKTNRPWPGAVGGAFRDGGAISGGEVRTGAVSSFGMSGTNVHMVVQSYAPAEGVGRQGVLRDQTPYYLLALSAKTEESLREKIRDMIEVLQNKDLQEQDLSQISYTLLEGRQHFNHRCAIVIQDREDAVYVLKQADRGEKLPNLFQGKVPGDFRGQKAIEQYVQDLLVQISALKENRNKYQEILCCLADFYRQGYSIDWKQLYGGVKPGRIHLPTYPFAREQYWAPETDTQPGGMTTQIRSDRACWSAFNPLLHQNTSDFSEQRFSSTFTGEEFFLKDHLVQGRRFLPGVAYLEMARAAAEAATGVLGDERIGIKLTNIVWIRPIVVEEQPVQVHIGLFPEENGEISYEIYNLPPGLGRSDQDNIEPFVYSQGKAVLNPVTENSSLDLSAIKARCNQSIILAGECYDAFKTMGIEYGPAHRGIEMIHVGQGQVLAKLVLPAAVSGTLDQFILHPSIMDSALQATLGLVMDSGDQSPSGNTEPRQPYVPFALQELEILGQITSTMWALVRYSNVTFGGLTSQAEGGESGPTRMRKFDIDICDDQGTVKVRVKGFTTRVLEEHSKTGNGSSVIFECSDETLPLMLEAPIEAIKLVPVWDIIPVEMGQRVPSPTDRVVVTGGTKNDRRQIREYYPQAQELEIKPKDTIETIISKLEAYGSIEHILWVAPHDELQSLVEDALINRQNHGVIQVFRIIKALLHLGYGNRNLDWTVLTIQAQPVHKNEVINPTHASLYGLMGSLAKEYRNWKVRLVDLEANSSTGKDWPLADVFALPSNPDGEPFAYRGGEWYRQKLVPLRESKGLPVASDQTLYRTGGVYVVIGGAGGIGEAWSEYMIRTYQAQIVWIGRRAKDEAIQTKLDRLAVFGPSPQYISADATGLKDLQQAYETIKAQYSRIHGVIHSAIILLDQSLANMTEERFRAGLAAKVDVSVRIAQVFSKEPLDFVMFFSAMQSFIKAPGQSNYASGCTFKDAFAHRLAREWPCTVRVVNWGYWGSVGIVASNTYQNLMAQVGLGSIEPPKAMEALEKLLAGPIAQIVFVKTTKPLDGMDQVAELFTVYPAVLPSKIKNINHNISIAAQFTNVLEPSTKVMDTGRLLEKVEAALVQSAAQLLMVKNEEIDASTELNEYGFDQIKLAEYTDQLNQAYHFELNFATFSEYSTLHRLAEYITENYRDRLAELFPDQVSPTPETSTTGSWINEIEELISRLLWGQLQSIGLFTEKNPMIADLKMRLSNLYNRWLDESIRALTQQNYLQYDGKSYTVIDPTPIDIRAVWQEWDQKKDAWLKDPNLKSSVVLVEATLRALPRILTGEILATDIMFPDSSMKLVEGIFKNNQVADAFNEVLADIVVAYVEERLGQEPSAQIRIIEIGAGTGGTSTMVFRKLTAYHAHIQEYCYTDISRAFLIHAEKEYGPWNPYLTFQIFNVESPLAGQDMEPGKFDLAIATNVLHATKSIRETIRNVKATLRSNGLILLNEMSTNSMLIHLTFGLLEGWWRYEDPELRIPGCPSIYPETWQAILENEGFRSVFFPAQTFHHLGQQIVVAESDGIVRQKYPRTNEPKPGAIPIIKREQSRNSVLRSTERALEIRAMQNPAVTKMGGVSPELLRDQSRSYLKKLIGETLRIPYHKIDSAEPFEKYGIDSIMVVQLTNSLSKVFDNVSSTLFFEYQTIDALVEYLLNTKKEMLLTLLGLENQNHIQEVSGEEDIPAPAPTVYSVPVFRRTGRFLQLHDPKIKESSQSSMVRDIAVIGLAGRYPLAENVLEFWNNLKDGKNCITEIPADRWDWREYYVQEKGKAGTIYSKWGGFIKNIDKFDPLFFHISPKDAENMDPQERLFLETAYASIEDAGYTPATLCETRKIGVFAGVMNANYPTGVNYWSIANRISYLFNFQGPSMAVDTACSSSLTAIHLALESLYSGISECAIAGGVNLIIDPVQYMKLSGATMLSVTNECKSFGDGADGFVDGEGVGAIVLKPLAKAVADGDHIYGIIKGSLVNSGGKNNGYTVPNPNAQCQLIAGSLKRAGVNARAISYVEAHGTGTALGDPIEIAGLTRAFEQDTQEKQFCAVGSAKSNIGHLESAAGIAGVTKVLLQLKYQKLVPSLHSRVLNPNIDFSDTPFLVQQTLAEWKRPVAEIHGVTKEFPRIAGVSSFGAGGANAHVVIQEYVSDEFERPYLGKNPPKPMPVIIVLSAKNEDRLKAQVRQLLAAIRDQQFVDHDLVDMAFTLQVGREAMEERLGLIVGSMKELEEKLRRFLKGENGIGDLYYGQVKRNQESLVVLGTDEEMQETIDKWIARQKFEKLLDLWVKGLVFDWNKLYGDNRPRRISLPTYPFARESYWILENNGAVEAGTQLGRMFSRESNKGLISKGPERELQTMDISGFRVTKRLKEPMAGTLMLTPVWDVVPIQKNQFSPPLAGRLIVVGGTAEIFRATRSYYPHAQLLTIESEDDLDAITRKLEAHGTIDHVLWIAPVDALLSVTGDALIEAQDRGVLRAFRMVKALLGLGYGIKDLDWTVITFQTQVIGKNEIANPTHASLHGLIGSMAKEFPNWKIRLIDLEAGTATGVDWPVEDIFRPSPDPQGNVLVYRNGQWYRQKLTLVQSNSLEPTLYKTGGVYVVIGGAGGIGEVFSEYMIRRYQARIVWIGRRPQDEFIQKKLDKLGELGPAPLYITADATDRRALQQAYEAIKAQYLQIHGLIHSAIVLLDKSLANMDEERFRAGLSAKVDVSIRMAQVFGGEPLDFVMFFSSLQSFAKLPGQSNYAAGCTFKDAFAQRLACEWPCPVKIMNWGYWGSVGIVASKAYQDRMAQLGLGSIEPPEAMEALERLLAGPVDQIALLKTTKPSAMEEISPAEESITVYPDELASSIGNLRNHMPAARNLKQILARAHK